VIPPSMLVTAAGCRCHHVPRPASERPAESASAVMWLADPGEDPANGWRRRWPSIRRNPDHAPGHAPRGVGAVL